MKSLIALAALCLAVPAFAQDKGKAEFTPSAEYRARYFYMQNPTGSKATGANDSFAEQRFKVGLAYKANEKFSARLTLIHASDFGSNSGDVGATNTVETNKQYDSGNPENLLNVNEAYLNWMWSDDMSIRIGRQNFQIGDGSIMSINDWEQNPFAFDGLTANWEAEFGRFQVLVFNYREEAESSGAATNTTSTYDQKHTAYGLNFDLKTMPEVVKNVNVHVIKDNADLVYDPAATTAPAANVNSLAGQDITRYGANAGFKFGVLELKGWYERQSGKYKMPALANAATGATELTAEGQMYQAELGAKFEDFMGSHFYVNYHVDSGDKDATDGKAGAYDPYFYERHDNAGLMDLFGWGNLTSGTVGWTFRPVDSSDIGVSYTMFSRTEKGSGPTMGRFGQMPTSAADSKKLGDEIDLWAEHRFDGGLSGLLRAGYFMPGAYYDNSTTNAGDPIWHLSAEAKISF